jgi:dihydroxy-acid dehydratase
MELCHRWYSADGPGDESVLPRSIATEKAFQNAMALDVAMGGSTNTVLHILAAAHEAEVNLTMADIDAVSRRVPCLANVSPSSDYHMEDVHRAGGIPAILGELDRAGLLHRDVHAVHAPSLKQWLADWDIRSGSPAPAAVELFHAAPGGVRTTTPFSTANRWSSLDTDAAEGCIRDRAHAYTIEGGLAVLYGNLAKDGAVLKTAGVPEEIWHFEGPARVVESQEQAVPVILARELQPGDVLVVRYEGPAGGPGMQEMLHPQGRPAGQGVRAGDRRQVLRRFVRRGCRAHLPGSRRGGVIGLVEDGDLIVIDVQERALRLMVDDDVLAERRAKMDASERPWQPVDRQRPVAKSLRAYARMATSAATGAVRDLHR